METTEGAPRDFVQENMKVWREKKSQDRKQTMLSQVTRKELTGRNSAASSIVQHNHKAGAVPKYLKVRIVMSIMMAMLTSFIVMMTTT